MFFTFDLNRLFNTPNQPDIPKDAVKTEEVIEQDGYKTITTTWVADNFRYVVSTTEKIVTEKDDLKTKLKEAVAKEDYRLAAELSEQIKLLEKG